MCGEAGCLHCGFTSATSHPLFKSIISCSIIQMIFIRANYTGPCPAEKMARVFYCCTHMQKSALLRLFKWGPQEPLAGLVSSEGVSPLLSRVTINYPL